MIQQHQGDTAVLELEQRLTDTETTNKKLEAVLKRIAGLAVMALEKAK